MLLDLEREEKWVDPRVKRTRKLILDAFIELMREKSFEDITIQDIAERATVNRVTFYAHFTDKYALLEYTMRIGFRERLRSQLPEDSGYSPENVARLTETVCEFLVETTGHCPPPHGNLEPLMEKQIKAELYETLTGWLADRDQAGPGEGPSQEQAAMVASWAIYGAAVQWAQQKPAQTAEEYTRQVLPLILGSLQPVVR